MLLVSGTPDSVLGIIYYLYKGAGSYDNFKPNQYQPITILVARTQCVFSVSLRTGKRLARTTVKRIVISPADKQKQNNTNAVLLSEPELLCMYSKFRARSCCYYGLMHLSCQL